MKKLGTKALVLPPGENVGRMHT